MKILELFGGIGACSKALEKIGIDYEIADYVEIDKYAVASYNAIHNTDFKPQDIREWDKDIDVDLIMHGSPCQDFSVAGKGAGGDEGSGTRSSLMYETIRIVNKLKPKYVIWENVKNLLSKKHKHNFDKYVNIMSEGGYNSYYQVLNAKDYGIPQNRERVFTISIRQDIDKGYTFPEKQELKLKLKDMLEDEVDEKYYLSDKQIERIQATTYVSGNEKNRIQVGDITNTLCARDYKDPKCVKVADFRYDEGLRVRKEPIYPTIMRKVGEASPSGQPLLIKNNTKMGYLEAEEGDDIDIENIDSKTRRGRVQKGMMPALTGFQDKGVVVKEINKNAKHQQDLVQSEEGICRTIPAGTHGSTPHLLKTVVESKKGVVVRKDIKEIEKYCEYCGKQLERKRFNGRLEDFTVFKNRKYCNRECMKRAYLKIGENEQSYSNAHTTARKINELILHKEVCELCGSDKNLDIHHIDGNWKNNHLNNLMCLCRSCHTKYERNKCKMGGDEPIDDRLRIRKLTPKECWRL